MSEPKMIERVIINVPETIGSCGFIGLLGKTLGLMDGSWYGCSEVTRAGILAHTLYVFQLVPSTSAAYYEIVSGNIRDLQEFLTREKMPLRFLVV